jgi:hypothetical protein
MEPAYIVEASILTNIIAYQVHRELRWSPLLAAKITDHKPHAAEDMDIQKQEKEHLH